MHAYERALQANPNSTAAMNAIGMLLKGREAFDKALEFFRAIVQLEQNNGEAWGNLGMSCRNPALIPDALTVATGHCYLMTENLQKAYDAYQQALVNLRDPKVSPMYLAEREGHANACQGSNALVWHRHSLRPLRQL